MSYSKQWKGIQDYYPGYQDWNRLVTNDQDIRYVLLDLEHGTVPLDPGQIALSFYDFLGNHDANEIPRAAARVAVTTLSSGAVQVGQTVQTTNGASIVSISRSGVGQFSIMSLMGQGAAKVFAEIACETTGATPIRRAEVRFNDGSTNGYGFVGWEILLLQWNSGAVTWDATDFSFGFTAWEYRT